MKGYNLLPFWQQVKHWPKYAREPVARQQTPKKAKHAPSQMLRFRYLLLAAIGFEATFVTWWWISPIHFFPYWI